MFSCFFAYLVIFDSVLAIAFDMLYRLWALLSSSEECGVSLAGSKIIRTLLCEGTALLLL